MERTEIDIDGNKHYLTKAIDKENCYRSMNTDIFLTYAIKVGEEDFIYQPMLTVGAENEEEAVEKLRELLDSRVLIVKDPFYRSPP